MRPRSLFWTFAGVFLTVVAAAAVVQFIVGAGVLRPMALQNARELATQALDRVAPRLAALPDAGSVPEVIGVLHANPASDPADIVLFCVPDGPMVLDRRVPAATHHLVEQAMVRAGLIDSATAARAPLPFAPNARDGRPGGPPEFAPGDGPPPPDLGPGDEAPPPRHAPPDEAPPAVAAGPPPRGGLAVLAHRSVVRDGRVLGELAVVGPAERGVPWTLPGARLLLLLPIAVLAAGAAGLIMVRILVRRLRVLDDAAGRVIDGDLAARIDSQAQDEIGRLERRFDLMTTRLGAARTRLEESDRQRRQLLADVSHELATPLTSIRGYVETLLDPAVATSADERTTYLNDVLAEARRLEDMTGELFDLSRLEAGATPLEPVRLDWTSLCRNIARRLEPRFRDAGLALAWAGGEDAAWVRADGRRLEQVVENLLVNALRYVPAGGRVELRLDRAAGAASARHRLTVSDDGPGIAADELPHVFERFYRAEAARSLGGTGLGLAIVAEIVRQHDGLVRAEPRVPHGVAFVVELAAAPD